MFAFDTGAFSGWCTWSVGHDILMLYSIQSQQCSTVGRVEVVTEIRSQKCSTFGRGAGTVCVVVLDLSVSQSVVW